MTETSVSRQVLTALAWAKGPGLPWETIWPNVAQALLRLNETDDRTRTVVTDSDIRKVLDHAGSYIVEDVGPGGRSVFRPSHDLLAAHLRDQSGRTARSVEHAITRALLQTVPTPGNGPRRWAGAHPYLRTYLADHACAAGPDTFSALLHDHGYLAAADPTTLTPLLTTAQNHARSIVEVYRRARPLLGPDFGANAAQLSEAAHGLGINDTALGIDREPLPYATVLATHRPDNSVLTLIGHTDRVNSVAFGVTRDGLPVVASGGDDGTVRIWDPVTGEPLMPALSGHTDRVNSVAFGVTRDGLPVVASGGDDGTVRIWDPVTGEPLMPALSGHTDRVNIVAFGVTRDGLPVVASGGDDGTVRIWDPVTGQLALPPLAGDDHGSGVTAIAFGTARDGRPLLASATDDGTVHMWNPATGQPRLPPLTGHQTPRTALAFFTRPDGESVLACIGNDGSLRLWNPDSGRPTGQRHTRRLRRTRNLTTLAVSGPGSAPLLLATADMHMRLQFWNMATGDGGRPLMGHTDVVTSLAFGTGSDGSHLLASASNDGTIRIWNTTDNGDHGAFPAEDTWWWLMNATVSFYSGPDGRQLLAAARGPGNVQWWELRSSGPSGARSTSERPWGSVMSFATTRAGHPLLALAGKDGTIRLAALDHQITRSRFSLRRRHRRLSGHTGAVKAITCWTGPDGRPLLASAGEDGTVRIWDPDAGAQVVPPLTGHTGTVTAVAFGVGATGRPLLASAGDDGTVRIWDPDTGAPVVPPLTGHTGTVTAVAFGVGHNGRSLIASAGEDGTVRIWDPDTGAQIVPPLTGHTGTVTAVAFGVGHTRRPLLASAGEDSTVRIWDPHTGTARLLVRRRAPVLAMTSQGSRIALADAESIAVIIPNV